MRPGTAFLADVPRTDARTDRTGGRYSQAVSARSGAGLYLRAAGGACFPPASRSTLVPLGEHKPRGVLHSKELPGDICQVKPSDAKVEAAVHTLLAAVGVQELSRPGSPAGWRPVEQ